MSFNNESIIIQHSVKVGLTLSKKMASYSINDLEKITGIKAHTIRIWEKRYDVVHPDRTPTNIRYYSDADLVRLLNISTLNRYGFRISEIVALPHGELTQKISELSLSGSDFESQINSLILSMLNLDEDLFEKVFSASVLKIGFEKTITQILYPLLERIGMFWQIGTINPGQEHFISNLIRQKIIVAIDAQRTQLSASAKSFLLYLPENEPHELGLLFLHFLLKRDGNKSYYLGQNVPFEALVEICAKVQVDYLITYLISSFSKKEIPFYLSKLSESFPEKKIFITGLQARKIDFALPKNICLFNTSVELLEKLKAKVD
ncbi:MAG TPA: hypothetical protein DCM62_06965 [Bacteroidales bacterium]|nr:hypothetical protein [Bacteroidales bacterium]